MPTRTSPEVTLKTPSVGVAQTEHGNSCRWDTWLGTLMRGKPGIRIMWERTAVPYASTKHGKYRRGWYNEVLRGGKGLNTKETQ